MNAPVITTHSFRFALLCLALLCALMHKASSQTGEGKASTRKMDTYDDKIGGSEHEQWRLENFRELLEKEPSAHGYIIAYGGKEDPPGKARRFALRARNYLIELRGVAPSRVIALDGGRRNEFAVELWLVPAGAMPPAPTPTLVETDDPGDNLFYDSFDVGYDNFGNKTEDAIARLGGFIEALKKEPRSWGCIVAYAHAGDDNIGEEWDAPGTGLKLARELRRYVVRSGGLNALRVSAVDGGYSGRIISLWVMRPNARFDKGPFVYANRLKAHTNGTLTVGSSSSLGMCCRACMRGGDPFMLRYDKKKRPRSQLIRKSTSRTAVRGHMRGWRA